MKRVSAMVAFACLIALPVFAQIAPPPAAQAPAAQAAPQVGPTEPLSRVLFSGYNSQKMNLTQSAEKVSEADYGFQPTKEVRTFGQMLAHVANTQFTYCAAAKASPTRTRTISRRPR